MDGTSVNEYALYIVSSDTVNDEWQTGANMEGSGCHLSEVLLLQFPRREWWKPRSRSVGMTGFSTEIRSVFLSNTSIERCCYTGVFHDMSNDSRVWKTRVQRPIWTCFSVVTFLSHPQNFIVNCRRCNTLLRVFEACWLRVIHCQLVSQTATQSRI
jgi:hypothetical protein